MALVKSLELDLHGAFWASTGYGEATRNMALAAHQTGMKLKISTSGFSRGAWEVRPHMITIRKWDSNPDLHLPHHLVEALTHLKYAHVSDRAPRMVLAPAPALKQHLPAGPDCRLIAYTMWELSELPWDWAEWLNQCLEVWVPCEYSKTVMQQSGVTVPVHVVPLPIDTERFKPLPVRLDTGDRFIFQSIFQWGDRKGWKDLLAAYAQAFTRDDPVVLRILTNYRNPEHKAQAEAVQKEWATTDYGRRPVLQVFPLETVPYDLMPVLTATADAAVIASRGEGACLPIMEAMACGVPVIAPYHTAFTDYLTNENSYPVACEYQPADGDFVPMDGHTAFWWAVTDVDSLAAQMRSAFCKADDRQAKAALGRQAILDRYSMPVVGSIIAHRLASLD